MEKRYWKSLRLKDGKIVSDHDNSEWKVGEWRAVPPPKKECKGATMNEIIDAEPLQERQRAPYRFRNMTIREVPIDEPTKGHIEPGYFRRAKEGLKIWGNTHRSE